MFEPSTTLTTTRNGQAARTGAGGRSARAQVAPPSVLDRVLTRVQVFLLTIVAATLLATASPATAGAWQGAAHASAQDDPSGFGGPVDVVSMMVDDGSEGKGAADGWESSDLPIIRWKDATGDINTNTNGQGLKGASASITQEFVNGTVLMGIGNTAFTLATFLTQMAVEARILDAAGPVVDDAFSAVGEAVFGSGLVMFVLVLAVAVGLWQVARSAGRGGMGTWKALAKPFILIGVLAVFVMGAGNSTETKPGAGSPWWTAQTTSEVVTTLATTPAAALTAFNLDAGYQFADDPDADDPLSCQTYMSEMADSYKRSGGSRASEISRALPQSISGMWEMTGLATYVQAQYGQNQYGAHVFCRGLDYNANLWAADKFEHSPDQITTQNVKAWPWANGRDMNDAAWNANIMHWSACRFEDGKFVFADQWTKIEALKKESAADVCSPWYDKDHGDYELLKAPVVFSEDQDSTVKDLDGADEELKDFVLTTQGWSTGASFLTAFMYSISAIIISGIFVVVALLVLLASIGMIAMMFGILFALLLDTLPSRTTGRLQGFVMKFFGLTFVTAFATLIFAILIMFTSILLNIGRGLVGDVPILMMMWAAVAPILSIIMLHLLFVSWFKMPSPVSPSGAKAWTTGLSTGNLMSAAGALNMARNARGQGGGPPLSSDPAGLVGEGRGGQGPAGQGENASDQMTPAGSGQSPEEIDQAYAGLQKASRDQAVQGAEEKALSSGMTPQAAAKSGEMAGARFDKSAAAMGTKAEAKAANAMEGGKELSSTGIRGRGHTLFVAPMANARDGYKDWKADLDASKANANGSALKTAGAYAGSLARGAGRLAKGAFPAVAATTVGALVGSIIAPGVGTMAGAAIGGGLVRARGYAKDRAVISKDNLERQRENIGAYRAAQLAKANEGEDNSQLPPAPAQTDTQGQASAGQQAPAQAMPAAAPPTPPAQQGGGDQGAPALSQTRPPQGTRPPEGAEAGRQQPGTRQGQESQQGPGAQQGPGRGSDQQNGPSPSGDEPPVVKRATPGLQQSGPSEGGREQVSPAPTRPQSPPPPAPSSPGVPPEPPR